MHLALQLISRLYTVVFSKESLTRWGYSTVQFAASE